MPANFPPVPLYPDAIDNDRTLFLVHNTVETVISSDNPAWSEEIEIRPVRSDKPELWSDNGFATISGELLYYNNVEKNGNGKVIKLTGCVRNLGGNQTKYNIEGTDIRSFVIAEHHNQLVDTIIEIEKFLGTVDCNDEDTLNCCIDELDIPDCVDDGGCPDILFDFQIVSEDTCEGTLINYQVDINGNFNNFRLDFGDGTFTTVPENGTKTYPPGTVVDPFVTVKNTLCEIVVTGLLRNQDEEPERNTDDEDILIPFPPIRIPTLVFPEYDVPTPDISIPPLVTPCFEFDPISISISIGDIDIQIPPVISIIPPNISPISLIAPQIAPISLIVPPLGPISIIPPTLTPISIIPPVLSPISLIVPPIGPISIIPPVLSPISIIPPNFPTIISFGPVNIPSIISITPVNIPSIISFGPANIPSVISIVGVNIPKTISVIDDIPEVISVIDDIPEIINVIDDIPDFISLIVPDFGGISVNWGDVPTICVTVSIACPSECGGDSSPTMRMNGILDDDLSEIPLASMNVDYEFAGIPSKIIIEPPDIPAIKFDIDGLKEIIKLMDFSIPEKIVVEGMHQIPSTIKIDVPVEMPSIKIDTTDLPKMIPIEWGDNPREIKINAIDMPSVISIKHDIPSVITVEGMVDVIRVEGIPDFIPLRFENPEDLVFRVEPAEVKIKLDIDKLITQDGEGQYCFALTPCKV